MHAGLLGEELRHKVTDAQDDDDGVQDGHRVGEVPPGVQGQHVGEARKQEDVGQPGYGTHPPDNT